MEGLENESNGKNKECQKEGWQRETRDVLKKWTVDILNLFCSSDNNMKEVHMSYLPNIFIV